MKTNRDMILSYLRKAERKSGEEYAGSTTQELADALGIKRCNISTQLNRMTEEGLLMKSSSRPVFYRLKKEDTGEESQAFRELAGSSGSLKNAIRLAKAAVLYPGAPLPILLSGPAGTGKTHFAAQIQTFSKEMKISEGNGLKEIDCRYYTENESALRRALEDSRGQEIFINHFHLLGQHSHLTVLRWLEQEQRDRGRLVVCAFDCENHVPVPEYLAESFPVCISFPSLEARGLQERFELVKAFLIEESVKMRKTLKLNSEVFYCLMLYRCSGEIRQLRNDIRVGCANAYVREFRSTVPELHLYVSDFPAQVRGGILNWKYFRKELENMIPRESAWTFSDSGMTRQMEEAIKNGEDNIYALIEKKEEELSRQGIPEDEISSIVGADIEHDLKKLQDSLDNRQLDKKALSKMVDERIIEIADRFLNEAGNTLGKAFPVSVFYGLCLHLSAFLEKRTRSRVLSREKVVEIMEAHEKEYNMSLKLALWMEEEFQVSMPSDEVVIITMFICRESLEESGSGKPVVLIAMHGTSAAASISNVVNALTGSRNTYAFDFPLDMDMDTAYQKFAATIQRIHQGKGILMLHDVGSVKTIASLAMQNTGIPIRCIEVPFTLFALECAQRAGEGEELEDVYREVLQNCRDTLPLMRDSYQRAEQEKVIVTLCMTGQGGAVQIKNYIEQNMELKETQVIPLAVSDPGTLLKRINTILEKHEIICMIGTYDPKIHNIPFISIAQLFETPAEKLPLLLAAPEGRAAEQVDYEEIYGYLKEQLPDLNIQKLRRHLPRAVALIKKSAGGLNEAQELGLFMHLACSVSRLQAGEELGVNRKKNQIISSNKKLYSDIKEILKPLETAFGIKYNDDAIAGLIEISKRI